MKKSSRSYLMIKVFAMILIAIALIGCTSPVLTDDAEYSYVPNTTPDDKSTAGNPPTASSSPYYCQGEFYSTKINGRYSTISYDYKPAASNLNTVHIGSNSSNIYYGVGDTVTYSIYFSRAFNGANLQFRYSDDVAGNIVNVYIDDVLKGSFTTADTGTWNSFTWHPTVISLGNVTAGTHVVKFYVTRGGSYGMDLDQLQITGY